MKVARTIEVIGTLIVGVGCYLVAKDTMMALIVAFVGLVAILAGTQIEEMR